MFSLMSNLTLKLQLVDTMQPSFVMGTFLTVVLIFSNVCRQTGAGKTHTMMGSKSEPGIIPRAINKIFDLVDKQPETVFSIQTR